MVPRNINVFQPGPPVSHRGEGVSGRHTHTSGAASPPPQGSEGGLQEEPGSSKMSLQKKSSMPAPNVLAAEAGPDDQLQVGVEKHPLRGSIAKRTYGTNTNLYISLFLLTIVGPI